MTMDLFPTFAAIAKSKNENLDGINLLPLLLENKPLPGRTLFWRMGPDKAVRQGPWKLCIRGKNLPELYQLSDDIGEKTNLAEGQPELVNKLQRSLSNWETEVDRSARESK